MEANGLRQPNSVNGTHRNPINRAKRVKVVDGNVWQWSGAAAAASKIQPVSNLGTGFIEYNPPQFLIDAHQKALQKVECNQYGPVAGMPVLKEALSKTYSPQYGRTIDPDSEISVTTGASEGLLSSIMAFVEPGDEVILMEPVFDLYVYLIGLAGGIIRYIPIHPPAGADSSAMSGNEWTVDLKELEDAISPKTKMLILNNPQNPLGKVFTKEELLSIGTICVNQNLVILCDEVYERIHFMPSFTHMAALNDEIAANTLTVSSIGKLFNATGWRLGFVIGQAHLIEAVQYAHMLLCYTTAGPVQEAAAFGLAEAERSGWWEENRRQVESKVTWFCEVLDELGLPVSRKFAVGSS